MIISSKYDHVNMAITNDVFDPQSLQESFSSILALYFRTFELAGACTKLEDEIHIEFEAM